MVEVLISLPPSGKDMRDGLVTQPSLGQTAEVLNGRLAMMGFVAAVGSYLTTGQVIPGIW